MYKNAARPKAIFTLWVMLNRKLATVDRIAAWGVVHDTTCVMCKNAEESLDHMFLQCQYAEEVCERVLTWAGICNNRPRNWIQFINWSIKNGKGKTTQAQLFKMIMAESVYTIWNERNKRIFEDKKCVIDEVVKRIAYVTIVRSSSTISNIICHRKI